ncbi:glutamate receptor 2.7-like [Magnolia sinica]|uniref:glutamate receptor 2.7-like n=1 Tax=Magnolia sinica TaxID=86752 RepID=UPI0026593BBE|nr:glutamate receptor 2.7-like [Magnolia sinica]
MKHQIYLFFSFFSIFCALSLCHGSAVAQINGPGNATVPVHVGVVLDLESWVGKMSMSCIFMAVSDFYATHSYYTTRLVLHTRDSKNDTVAAASAALDLLNNVGVQAIIGPQKSTQAHFMVDLGSKAHVPILSFSAVSSSLSPIRTPYFIRTAQNDSSQVKAIAAIIRSFRWRSVILIYEDTDYGNGLVPYLVDAFEETDTRISYRSVIPLSAPNNQITGELYKLMTMQTRVFIVHMSYSLASRFFLKVNEFGMMGEGYIWIITDGLTNLLDSLDSSVIDSMQGVLGVKQYVDKTKEMGDFMVRWRKNFIQMNPNFDRAALSILGIRAYDTVWALAIAAERVGAEKSYFQKPEIGKNSTELVGVSQTGPKLLCAIKKMKFKGLGCEFHLVDGELPSSAFQIVNVIGKGERKVGFWTPDHGISRVLNMNLEKIYSTNMADFGPIIWPGDTFMTPKGWVIPTSGKKLRIGVPIKLRFTEFLKVKKDSITNATTVTGYCIDVFKSVMEALPYAVPYEFIPYQKADGRRAGSYADLIYQVYLQKFDAMVADTTITANRSLYVDFTLPYTESGVAMVVPIKDDESKKAWIFLKPLTVDLWLTSGVFFIFTGFVVWILEHRLNDEFRGPPSQQLGMIFWFSFSTLVFAHSSKLVNNLSRFVVIIWVFVVLILTSSYTASLTSMLTVQQLQPTVTDITDLKKNGDYVGHQKGPFMTQFMKHFDFDESKLKPYTTPEEYAEALSKDGSNGGVSAVFDEIPYLKLFLAKYCDKYTMVGPTYKTGGFGFVFSKGSPLVTDVSRAILNVTEGDTMAAIERKWFGHQTTCPDQSTTIASNSLTLASFRGLFLIAGIASTSALVIFLVSFLLEHKHVLIADDSNSSIWKVLIALARWFDQKELSARTLRRTDHNNGLVVSTTPVQASPASQWPLSNSNCTSGRFDPQEDEEISSIVFAFPNPSASSSAEMADANVYPQQSSAEMTNVNVYPRQSTD